MSFSVRIRQHDAPITVQTGDSVLESALAQGVPYPHGCRSGNCGACKSRLHSGEVQMLPFSEFALTPEEEAEGFILACRAVPWEDCEISWLDVDEVMVHPLRRLRCVVRELDDATHDIRRIRLEVEAGGPFDFSAGQYASVTFDDLPPRDYSMANRSDDAVLEFHVRRIADGAASRYAAERLQRGERVRVEGPYGSAWLREQHRGPILAIAGGSGLAPIKSIVETALARGMPQPVHLYFGVRAERDLYLEEHFSKLAAEHPNLEFLPVLSAPQGPTARRTGFVSDAVAGDFPDFDGFKAYVCGPPVMVEAVQTLLRARGMRREDIHADAFYTAAERPVGEGAQ